MGTNKYRKRCGRALLPPTVNAVPNRAADPSLALRGAWPAGRHLGGAQQRSRLDGIPTASTIDRCPRPDLRDAASASPAGKPPSERDQLSVSATTRRMSAPYASSFFAPTPLIAPSSSSDCGQDRAISA